MMKPTQDKNPFYTKEELKEIEQNMKKELCWNVYCPETTYTGRPKILVRNIFQLNWPMNARLYDLRKEKNKEIFANGLNSEIAYSLWAKSEYETYLSNSFDDTNDFVKIDPYQQVKLNWDSFVNYCWENKKLFRKFKKEHKYLKEIQWQRRKKLN